MVLNISVLTKQFFCCMYEAVIKDICIVLEDHISFNFYKIRLFFWNSLHPVSKTIYFLESA